MDDTKLPSTPANGRKRPARKTQNGSAPTETPVASRSEGGGNTAANRAWTFGVTGRERMVTHHGQALLVFGITYAATTLALAIHQWVAPDASTLAQTAVVAVANVLSTVLRFVAMRRWIFVTRR